MKILSTISERNVYAVSWPCATLTFGFSLLRFIARHSVLHFFFALGRYWNVYNYVISIHAVFWIVVVAIWFCNKIPNSANDEKCRCCCTFSKILYGLTSIWLKSAVQYAIIAVAYIEQLILIRLGLTYTNIFTRRHPNQI